MKQTNRLNKQEANTGNEPIVYHQALEEGFEAWAMEIGKQPSRLRRETGHAIRNRNGKSHIGYEGDRANERRSDVYTLPLDACVVYFSIEADGIVVRGYGWDMAHEPLSDFDGGGFWT